MGTLSTTVQGAQATDCNNTAKKAVPGKELGKRNINEIDCGGGELQFSVEVESGKITKFLVAGAANLSLTLKLPGKCRDEYSDYSDDVYNCGTPLMGSHCDQDGDSVTVEDYKTDEPCPHVDLAFLNGNPLYMSKRALDLITGGVPLSVDCNPPVRTSMRSVDSATSRDCKTKDSGPGVQIPGQVVTLGPDRVDWVTTQDPVDVDMSVFVGDWVAAPSTLTIEGLGAVMESMQSDTPEDLPSPLETIFGSQPSIAFFDSLDCYIKEKARYDNPNGSVEWFDYEINIAGHFLQNGDADFLRTVPYIANGDIALSIEAYTIKSGNVYMHRPSGNSGIVYPHANGASAIPMSSKLSVLDEISTWLANPAGLRKLTTIETEIHSEVDGQILASQAFRYDIGEGRDTDGVFLSMFGGSTEYVVESSDGVSRVTELRVVDAHGQVSLEKSFRDFEEVLPGVWRPMKVVVKDLDMDGGLARERTFLFGGKAGEQDVIEPISLPSIKGKKWYYRLNGN